jgi:hypothetical protein
MMAKPARRRSWWGLGEWNFSPGGPWIVIWPRLKVIPVSPSGRWYARRVGVAAAREINEIPAGRPPTEESRLRAAGISPVALVLAKGAPAGIRHDLGVAARGERKPVRATTRLDHSANGMARYHPLPVERESRPNGLKCRASAPSVGAGRVSRFIGSGHWYPCTLIMIGWRPEERREPACHASAQRDAQTINRIRPSEQGTSRRPCEHPPP